MRLPRTETALAAVLLLSAAPFALAVPPPAATPPNTPGASAPQTPPGETYPGTMTPRAAPGATPQSGSGYPHALDVPGTSRTDNQNLQGNNAMPGDSSHGHGMSMRSAERVPQADIRAAKSAKISLTDAINTAQQQNHGDVVSARFELRHGQPEYLIRTFDRQSQKEWLGHIDANTGKVISTGRTIPLSRLPQEDRQELTASSTAATTLAQAVQSAEQQRGGKALAAGLSARNGKVSYRTELLKSNGRTQMAMISPSSGQVGRYR